ncbi:putative HNHc nuclease [Novosphingobium tardum]|uniref:HNHc nuclease n=1 Tax=Novosphingobium tardum TaxID=1538021 RepID=A0ABV8RL73_9SPHN
MARVHLPPLLRPPRTGREAGKARACSAHRAWVRRHRCCVPGCTRGPVECAHVRCGTDGGAGLKPSDRWTLSLCREHHGEQHRIGERAFERRHGLDLKALAAEFARRSPHWRALAPTLHRSCQLYPETSDDPQP